MNVNKRERNLSVLGAGNSKKRGKQQTLPKIQINKPEVDWRKLWESEDVRKRINLDTFAEQTPSQSKAKETNPYSNSAPSYKPQSLWNQTPTSTNNISQGKQKSVNGGIWGNQTSSSSQTSRSKIPSLQDYATIKPDYLGYLSNKNIAKKSTEAETKEKAQENEPAQTFAGITDPFPKLSGGTYEGYPEMHISDNLYTNGYEYYLKDRGLNRIVSAKKDGSLQPSWDAGEPHSPWVTTIEKSLKAGKPMPRPTAFDLTTATDTEREFHSLLSDIYRANSQIIESQKRRKAEADEQATTQTSAPTTTQTTAQAVTQTATKAAAQAATKTAVQSVAQTATKTAMQPNANVNHSTTENSTPTVDHTAPRGNMPYPRQESTIDNHYNREAPLTPEELTDLTSRIGSLAEKDAESSYAAQREIDRMKSNVGRFSPSSSQSSSIYPQQYSGTNYLSAYVSPQSSATQNQLSNDSKSSNNSNEKEDNYPTEDTLTLTQNEPTRFRISIGTLQPELEGEYHKFASTAHTFSAEELSDTLKNKNATKNIIQLDKMSKAELISDYLSANRHGLSDVDNVYHRVTYAFLTGKGLTKINVGGNIYEGIQFDENSGQSKMLNDSDDFNDYKNDYLTCMKEIISEHADGQEIDIRAISEKLEKRLGKINFSDYTDFWKFDYAGMMGGTQNIEIDFEITYTSNGEYTLNTTMYINDWYGADADDISQKLNYQEIFEHIPYTPLNTPTLNTVGYYIDYIDLISNPKSIIPGLKAFFYLQHHHGCKPFPTQIIYKSEDKIKLD